MGITRDIELALDLGDYSYTTSQERNDKTRGTRLNTSARILFLVLMATLLYVIMSKNLDHKYEEMAYSEFVWNRQMTRTLITDIPNHLDHFCNKCKSVL